MVPRSLLVTALLAVAAAGCLEQPATDAGPAAIDPSAADATIGPATETVEGSIQASASLPVRTVNYGGAFATPIALTETMTGIVLELEWTPSSPASESLSLWVRAAGAGNLPPNDPADLVTPTEPVARESGAGPLRIALSMEGVEPGDYEILVRAAEPGLAVEQAYTLHVTTFDGVAFDDAFTALGAADEGA